MPQLELSIIIVNYNMKGLLKQCLKGINRVQPAARFEVIVIDNASSDGSALLLHEWERNQPFSSFILRSIVRARNGGYGVANNEGMRMARGEWVLILNPDIAVLEGSIEHLIEYARAHQNVAIVAPKLFNPDRSMQYSCYRFPALTTPLYRRTPMGNTANGKRHVREYMMVDWDHETPQPVDWVMGSSMLVRRKAIVEIGGFDERFFMYFEDIDWCRRFWQSGYEVHYVPNAAMVHYHQRMSAETGLYGIFSWATRTHIQSALKYFLKYRTTQLPREFPSQLPLWNTTIPTKL